MVRQREYQDSEVVLPEATIGTCKYYRRCHSFDVSLGNGICMDCGDKGMDTRAVSDDVREHRNQLQNARYKIRVTKVRGHIE